MNAGRLNKRIVIQRLVTDSPARDSFGQPQATWTTFATVWASVNPLSGREFWAQQQVQNEVTTRFRIRYLSGVLPTMRISFNSEIYAIKFIIDPKEEHRELEILCAKGVENG